MSLSVFIAAVVAAQLANDFWVVTHSDEREASAINVGFAFTPSGEDYILTFAYTIHHQGTEASRWTTPAYTMEFLDFRCDEQMFRVRRSLTYSSVADPSGANEPDGPFSSVADDPRRQAQLDAVCQPLSNHSDGYEHYVDFWRAYGLLGRAGE